MKRLTIYVSLFVLFVLALARGASPIQDEKRWERYTGKGEDFTVSMPERPTAVITYRPARFVDFRKGDIYQGTLYGAYSDGVAYLLYSFPRRAEPLKQLVEDFASRYATSIEFISARDVTVDDFPGERYKIKFRELDGVLDFYATNKRVYILEVVGADENSPQVKRFLDSFSIGDGKKSDPAVVEVKPGADKSSQADSAQDSGPVFGTREVTRKAVIVLRQEPQYTEEARQYKVSGNVVIKAVLSSSGKVTNIQVTKSLPRGLTEKAVEVARQIIFIPAIKDGKFVSQTIQVEYNFSVY
jgi:TonB family protein